MKRYTFIMTSKEIGEVIDQACGETMDEAWRKWMPHACDWILKQLPDAGLDRLKLLEEVGEEVFMPIPELKDVWLVDLFPDNCSEVIEVIAVYSGEV